MDLTNQAEGKEFIETELSEYIILAAAKAEGVVTNYIPWGAFIYLT